MEVTDIGAKRFQFRFYNRVDLQRVLDGSPWFFSNHLIVWKMIGKRRRSATNSSNTLPILDSNSWV